MPCPVRPEANISHSRLRDGISPYEIEKISSYPPKGAINPLIDRTNLTTCAMRYPSLIDRINRSTLKRGAHKESITEVCYHNILCMSSFHFKILYLLQTGLLVNDSIQQVWPPSCKFVGYTTAFSILYQFKIL